MADGLPSKAKITAGGKSATFDPCTYFLGKRMEARARDAPAWAGPRARGHAAEHQKAANER